VERILARLRRQLLAFRIKGETPQPRDIPPESKQVTEPASSEDVIQRLQDQINVLTDRNTKLERLVEIKEKKIQLLLKRFNDSSQ
jgi:hypothetical protein